MFENAMELYAVHCTHQKLLSKYEYKNQAIISIVIVAYRCREKRGKGVGECEQRIQVYAIMKRTSENMRAKNKKRNQMGEGRWKAYENFGLKCS